MRENCNFVVPVNILTPFVHAPFSWAAQHTNVCFDYQLFIRKYNYSICLMPLCAFTLQLKFFSRPIIMSPYSSEDFLNAILINFL